MIVNPRCRDVRVAEPLLHLGDVGLVVKRAGDHRRAERMRADLKPERRRVSAHYPVKPVRCDPIRCDRCAAVMQRPKQRAAVTVAVASSREVIANQARRGRVQRVR